MTKYISKDHTEIICTLCKFSEGSLLNKRVIYTVLKPKAPEQVLDEKDKEGEMNSDE